MRRSRMFWRPMRAVLVLALMVSGVAWAQEKAARPRITGISHAAYFVSDLPKALGFWHDFLGFDVAYELKKPDGKEVRIAFIKINDHQHIELFNEPPGTPRNMMSHVAFTVDDIEAMRAYLAGQGIAVPASAGRTRMGDDAFEIKDPDGTLVEFVQTLPTGREAQAAGKSMPATRIGTAIYHVGFLVGNAQESLDFYGKLLGFTETWRGTRNPAELSWINMTVPDGTDYVELMLYHAPSNPDNWGTSNHTSLLVPDVPKAIATLAARPAYAAYGKPLTLRVGVNGKRQVNLFDPDGTRVEIMEAQTVSGLPTPSSTAPPPPPAR